MAAAHAVASAKVKAHATCPSRSIHSNEGWSRSGTSRPRRGTPSKGLRKLCSRNVPSTSPRSQALPIWDPSMLSMPMYATPQSTSTLISNVAIRTLLLARPLIESEGGELASTPSSALMAASPPTLSPLPPLPPPLSPPSPPPPLPLPLLMPLWSPIPLALALPPPLPRAPPLPPVPLPPLLPVLTPSLLPILSLLLSTISNTSSSGLCLAAACTKMPGVIDCVSSFATVRHGLPTSSAR
mmetsp:Transcript_2588/g.4976  ORF Transcript_2588/g.4976 Transcript_2588/m.4976 type:complete len:240 (+) Transcript_2588:536-1255(+)